MRLGHPQSSKTRRKIGRRLQRVWVIERITRYVGDGIIEFENGELLDCDGLTHYSPIVHRPGYPPFRRYSIPAERAFLRVPNLRRFCRAEGLDYGNLYRTYRLGGWYTDTAQLLSGGEEANVRSQYAIRACLNEGDYYDIPCERHSHCGFKSSCASCRAFATWLDGKPVKVGYSEDSGLVIHTASGYRRIFLPNA